MDQLQWVWGWQPALYLFLGGMGSGAFVTAAVLRFKCANRYEKTIATSMWAAVVCLSAGLLCLLTELTAPLRGLMMWQSFSNFSSWMTYGAWLVFGAVVVFGLSAVLATPSLVKLISHIWKGLKKAHKKLFDVLSVAGIALGLGVAAYTGVLLMVAPGVPLWNTLLLPCLFTISAIDTGVALVEIIAYGFRNHEPFEHATNRFLSKVVVALIVAELIVIAAFLAIFLLGDRITATSAAGATSALTLLIGLLAPEFWVLVITIGLIIPMGTAIKELRETSQETSLNANAKTITMKPTDRKHNPLRSLAGPIGVLVGGCTLRFLVLMAGVHADVISDTMASIFAEMVMRL